MSSVRHEKEKGVNVQVLLRCRYSFFFPFNSFLIMKSINYYFIFFVFFFFFFFFRPFSEDELRSNAPQVVTCYDYNREVSVSQNVAGKHFDRVFTFDKVFFFSLKYLIDFCDYFMDLFKPKCSLFNFWGSITIRLCGCLFN